MNIFRIRWCLRGLVPLVLCVWPELCLAGPAEDAALIKQALDTPMPAILEQAAGQLVFEGVYRHKSHGQLLGLDHRWIKRQEDGTLAVACELPFAGMRFYGEGGPMKGLSRYEVQSTGVSPYSLKMEFETGKVLVTRCGLRENWDRREIPVPAHAIFDPNSQQDPYCVAQAMFNVFSITSRSPEESEAYDWDDTGDGFAFYRTRLRDANNQEVTTAGARFRARGYVIEQMTGAGTAFKKRAEDITDVWGISEGVFVRVVRYSDEYEVDLVAWKTLEPEAEILDLYPPLLDDRSVPPPTIASQRIPMNESDRIKGCWTARGFVMPYAAAVYLKGLRGESGGPTDFGIGTSPSDCRMVLRNLPKKPEPAGEVKIGEFKQGEVIPFCMKSTWRESTSWASTSEDTESARVAFQDTDASLGGETAVEQIGPDRWLMQLDGADSYKYDDDDNDNPILLRLEKR